MITDMGLTIAIQADTVAEFDGDPEGLKRAVHNLGEEAQEALRRFVGNAKPQSDLAINFKGPEKDPLQGWIYGLTVAAKFDTDDLPGDCPAYQVHVAGTQ